MYISIILNSYSYYIFSVHKYYCNATVFKDLFIYINANSTMMVNDFNDLVKTTFTHQ